MTARGWLLALLAPAAALAQGSRLDGLPAATRAAIAPIIDSARAAGLPTTKLESRALEGNRKQAPATQIAAVVRQLVVNETAARMALGASAAPADIELGAELITRGVAASVLTLLPPKTPGRSVSATLTVLDDMIARGVGPDLAGSIAVSLARGGVGDEQLAAFKLRFEGGVAVGTPPATAASDALSERATRADGLGVSTTPTPTRTATPTRP